MPGRTMTPGNDPQPATERQRRARRTAWLLGGIALAVYLGFLASGVFGQ